MIKNLSKIPQYWLNLEDCRNILLNFNDLLTQEEPIPPFESRFKGKLEGILGSVKQTYSGEFLNGTVLDAAASYFNQLIRGHAFENGNKRCAVIFTHWFLLMNDVTFTLSPKEMYNFAVEVAIAGERQIKPDVTKNWSREIIRKFTKDWDLKKKS